MSYTIQREPQDVIQLDSYLKGRDPFYKTQTVRDSDQYTRTLPLANRHGSSRPSNAFTCEGREREFPGVDFVMSEKPSLW